MSVEPLDFLAIAKEIEKLKTEAAFRTVVSRSYYACYHYSQDMASLLDHVVCNGGAHVQHITKFTRAPNQKTRNIGYDLRQFHSMRTSADYDLNVHIDEENADFAIRTAEKLIEDIDNNS